jgi:hypothetical protein
MDACKIIIIKLMFVKTENVFFYQVSEPNDVMWIKSEVTDSKQNVGPVCLENKSFFSKTYNKFWHLLSLMD